MLNTPESLHTSLLTDFRGMHGSIVGRVDSGIRETYFVSVTDSGNIIETNTEKPFDL